MPGLSPSWKSIEWFRHSMVRIGSGIAKLSRAKAKHGEAGQGLGEVRFFDVRRRQSKVMLSVGKAMIRPVLDRLRTAKAQYCKVLAWQ